MYGDDTGLGAIAYQGSLRSKILGRLAARKVPSRTVNILRSKILAQFPKKAMPSVTATPAIAPLVAVTGAPMALPSFMQSAAAGSAGAGSAFSPAGESESSEGDALPVAASSLSPMVILAIGAAAFLLLGKKGR